MWGATLMDHRVRKHTTPNALLNIRLYNPITCRCNIHIIYITAHLRKYVNLPDDNTASTTDRIRMISSSFT